MKTVYNIILGYLLLMMVITVIGFTIRLKEKDKQYQALLSEMNYQIRFIQERGLIVQYDWYRTAIKTVSNTEYGYLQGVTSNVK